jgi:hypothetical protein
MTFGAVSGVTAESAIARYNVALGVLRDCLWNRSQTTSKLGLGGFLHCLPRKKTVATASKVSLWALSPYKSKKSDALMLISPAFSMLPKVVLGSRFGIWTDLRWLALFL